MAGCTQSYEDVATISASEEFYATIEGSDTDTRTYVDGNITTRWHADDRLTIFKKETYNREYKFKGRTGDNSGGFTQVSVDDDFYSSEQLDKNYAVYPHSNDNCFNKQTESFELIMPAEQTYAENTFGRGANTMVAVSDTGQLLFKNVGSFLRVRLWGENTAVSSITITSNGDEVIAGEAIVKPTMGGDPTCVMTGSEKSIILNCPTPITISESESTPTDFWIVLPPVIFENGFTVTVKNTDDEVQTFNKNEKFTFGRNLYYNFKREVTLGTGVDQSAPSSNEIWYTTTDGEELTLNNNAWLNVNITSNIYKNGKGVISFDNDITSINMGAFYNCYSLKSITLPAGVVRIGSYAFYDCDSLESISIPDGVNEICANAFDSCNNLENFIIPASVTNIGSSAFKDCISLKSITIPNSVTRISSTTFYGCHNLENISIPESITEIGAAAFYSCTSLKSINIPENIVDIDKEAFLNCTSLKNVYITNLEAWYNINFEEPLSNPMCAGANLYLNNTLVENIVIPESIIKIGNSVFCGCQSLKSIIIPESVTNIGFYAFSGCKSLESITLSDGITEIGEAGFRDCSSLASIILPESITKIGKQAFVSCYSLMSVYCASSAPPALGSDVFYDNASDRNIYVPTLSVNTYKEADGWKDYADQIVGYDFENDTESSSYNQIWYEATSKVIPNEYASFRANIVSNIYEDGNGVITFDGDVTLIGNSAFIECESLTSITIPESVTDIADHAFYDCISLKSVYCKQTVPPTLGTSVFFNNAAGQKFYVPKASVNAYKVADGWKNYAYDIVGYDF